jgi:hypothetical protein
MNPLFSACPVCGGELIITRINCPSCETVIEGAFKTATFHQPEVFGPEQLHLMMPFAHLSPEQLYFVLTFIRSEGRFNRMEEELGMSYPTLRNRLDEILRAMGFDPAPEGPANGSKVPGAAERQEILEALERGEIEMDAARRRLRGEAA